MVKALFLDRDGVLDALLFRNGEWGAPLEPSQVELLPGVREALDFAARNGWLIFVISNQPDAAKGKTTYPGLIGVDASREEANRQLAAAINALEAVIGPVDGLQQLARFVVQRRA